MPKYIKSRIKWFGSDVWWSFIIGLAIGLVVATLIAAGT